MKQSCNKVEKLVPPVSHVSVERSEDTLNKSERVHLELINMISVKRST